MSAIRQIMAMEGSVRYLQNSTIADSDKKDLAVQIVNVKRKVVALKKLARALKELADEVRVCAEKYCWTQSILFSVGPQNSSGGCDKTGE